MDDYRIALWSFNLGRAPASVEDLASMIEEGLGKAAAGGAQLLVLPEYLAEACLAFKPEGLPPDREMAFLAETGTRLLPLLKALPERYGASLLAGTWPVQRGEGITNTAVLLTADGRQIDQDKLCLTPFEQDPPTWQLTPGTDLKVFDLDGLRSAILICLDVEVPALSSLLAKEGVELLLVPSMTEQLSGYHRVYGCAKARAVELMCAVAVCGLVGTARGTTQNPSNVSGAALYLPCEADLGFVGIAGDLPPVDGADGQEPFLFADVPVQILRDLRSSGGEVWPGAWSAEHLHLVRT